MSSGCCDKTEKKLPKKEKTQVMGSVDLQRKREIWGIIFSKSNEDLYQRSIFQVSSMILLYFVLFIRKVYI